MKKIYLFALIFILIPSTIFAYSFKEKKTFTETEYENSEEVEWYDEHEYPYRVKIRDEDYDTTEYEYYNCDDYNDWISKSSEIANKRNSNKKANSSSTPENQTVTENIDPNVFYGKRKEECPTEEILYKSVYYMKPINSSKIGDINSASQYFYDDTKTAYFYPLVNQEDYYKFAVLVQDGFSELQQAIFIVDQCEFKKDTQGNWQLIKADSQKKDANAFAKINSDTNMLMKMLNAKFKGYDSDKSILSITYTCITNNLSDTSRSSGIYKSTKAVNDKIDYYKKHPSENSVTDGLNYHIFLTDYGESLKSYLDMIYDELERWNNGNGNLYVVKSYWDVALSMYSGLVDMGVQYKSLYGLNNIDYLCYKSDIGYIHNHLLKISKICGFRYP